MSDRETIAEAINTAIRRARHPFVGGFEPRPAEPCAHEWDGPTLREAVEEELERAGSIVFVQRVLDLIARADAAKCRRCGLYRRFSGD